MADKNAAPEGSGTTPELEQKRWHWFVVILIAVATLSFVYWVTSLGFYDRVANGDDRNLYNEARHFAEHPTDLIDVDYVSESALTSTHYMPMYYSYFVVLSSLFGDDARPYHLFGFTLHACNAILLFLLTLALTRSRWLGLAACCLFLLYPGNVETLRWVSSTLNHPPVVLFLLLTTISFIKYRDSNRLVWLIISLTTALLGCLNKQSFYPFFTVLIAYDILFNWKSFCFNTFLKTHTPFIVLSLGFMTIQLYRYELGWIHQFKGGVLLHPIIAIRLLDFARTFLWPEPTEQYIAKLFLITVVYVMALLTLLHSRNRPAQLAVLWMALLGIAAMTQNLRTITENIRYTYIMLPGFCLFIGSISKKGISRAIPFLIATTYLLSLWNAYL